MAFAPISPLTVDGFPKFLSMAYHRMIESFIVAFIDLNLPDKLVHAAPNQGLILDEIIGTDDHSTWNKDVLYRVLRACIITGVVKRVNDDKHLLSLNLVLCSHLIIHRMLVISSNFLRNLKPLMHLAN
jgi:hypothetical protein